jgi:hypothetical protein
VPESLEMLVTGDPVAEIDAALARAAARLRAARACGDTLAVRRLTAWIDYRLDQRLAFDGALEAIRLGKQLRFRPSALIRYLKERAINGNGDLPRVR